MMEVGRLRRTLQLNMRYSAEVIAFLKIEVYPLLFGHSHLTGVHKVGICMQYILQLGSRKSEATDM